MAGILLLAGEGMGWLLALCPVIVSLVLWRAKRSPDTTMRVWLVFALALSAGAARQHHAMARPALHDVVASAPMARDAPQGFTARLLRPPDRASWYRQQLLVELRAADAAQGAHADSASAGMRVAVNLADRRAVRELRPGDVITFDGEVRTPREALHAGQADGLDWLRREGLDGVIEADVDTLRVTDRERPSPLIRLASHLRAKFSAEYRGHLSEPVAALCMGAGLGMRGEVWGRDWRGGEMTELFARSGISHLLAVSGLHVGILAGALAGLGALLRVPRRWSCWLVIAALLVFLVMTGARPPTVRAVVMASSALLMLAYVERRTGRAVGLGLAVSAVLLLLWNPHLLFAPGFQLSFAAVLSLTLLAPRIHEGIARLRGRRLLAAVAAPIALALLVCHDGGVWLRLWLVIAAGVAAALALGATRREGAWLGRRLHLAWLPRPVRALLAAQLAIQAGCILPLSAWYFGNYSVAGNLVNLMVIPLAGVFVPATLAMGAAAVIPGIGGWAAWVLSWPVEGLGRLVFWIADLGSRPFPHPDVVRPQPAEMLAYFALLGACLVPWRRVASNLPSRLRPDPLDNSRRFRARRLQRLRWARAAAVLVIAAALGIGDHMRTRRTEVLVFDGNPSGRGEARPSALVFHAGLVVLVNPPAPRHWRYHVLPPMRARGHASLAEVWVISRNDTRRLDELAIAAASHGAELWHPADADAPPSRIVSVEQIHSGHPRAHPRHVAVVAMDDRRWVLVPDGDAASTLAKGAPDWLADAGFLLLPARHTSGEPVADPAAFPVTVDAFGGGLRVFRPTTPFTPEASSRNILTSISHD